MPNNYDALLQVAGQQYNVDPRLLASMMTHESGGNPDAVSPKGATGLMQVMPDTAREMGFSDVKDPVQNVFAGAKYLSQQLDKYKDPALALAAYNAGPGAVDHHGGIPPYPETQRYVQKVLGSYQGAPAQAAQAMPGLPPTGNASQASAADHFSKFMDNAGRDDSIIGAIDRVAASHGPLDGAISILNGQQGDQMPGLPPTGRNAQHGAADPFSKFMANAGGDDSITGAIDRVAAKHGPLDDAIGILNGQQSGAEPFDKLMSQADAGGKHQIQYIDDSNNPNAAPGTGPRIEVAGTAQPSRVPIDAKNMIGATVEPILTMATGALAAPIGGAVRLGSVALGKSFEDAKQSGENVSNMLTYHPQTVGGQASLAGLGNMLTGAKDAVLHTPLIGPALSAAGKSYDDTFVKGTSNPLMATINDQLPTVAANITAPIAGKALMRGADAAGNVLADRLGIKGMAPAAERVEPSFGASPNAATAGPQGAPARTTQGASTGMGAGAAAPGATKVPAFEMPDYPNGKNVYADSVQRRNIDVMKEIGLTNQRASAIAGDRFTAGTEYQHSKLDSPMGEVMREQLAKEQTVLKDYGQKIIADTGATAGAPEAVGQAIRAPLQGLSEHYDSGIKALYQAADARAGGVPNVQPEAFGKLLTTDSTFAGKAENTALRRGIRAYTREQNISAADGSLQPMNVQQAEGLRQYLNSQWSPQNSGLIGKIKESLDMDVAKAGGDDIYAQARQLHAERKNTLDNPKGIASLLNETGPDGINKQVPDELVAKKVLAMPTQQMAHVVETLKNLPEHLQPHGQQALAEIKGSIANEIYKAGDSGGTQNGPSNWNAANVTKQLNTMRSKMGLVFTPEEIAKFQTLNEAGHILQTPSAYPGAAVQGHNLLQRGLLMGPPAAGAAIGHSIGGIYGASIGGTMGAGLSSKIALQADMGRANKLRAALSKPKVQSAR
jgi:SLT domain-containing protein